MKISLVTNKSLKQLNDLIWIENKSLRANNAKIVELCGIKDKQIEELLKEKEILDYRATSSFLSNDKVLMDEIGNLAYEIDELLMVNESTHGLWEEAVYKNFELSNKLRKNKRETKKLIDSINSRSNRDIELHKQVSKLGKHEK